MEVELSLETQQLLESWMKGKGFQSADEAIFAGFTLLQQEDLLDDFAPGELDAMLEEAEEDYRKNGGLTREEVFDPIYAKIEELRRAK